MERLWIEKGQAIRAQHHEDREVDVGNLHHYAVVVDFFASTTP